MDFKTFTAQYFSGDAEKAQWCLANEAFSFDYRLSGSREGLQAILDTMTREEAKVYMRCFKDIVKADKEKKKDKSAKPAVLDFLIPILCFALTIWMFISGCSNILKRNALRDKGVQVQVTVTDMERKDSGENIVEYYTFAYTLDGKVYSFVDSPDRKYDVGETFTTYIDPDNPKVLVLPSQNLFFAFMLLPVSVGSLFLFEKARAFKKYIPYALVAWPVLMIATGILLRYGGACVWGGFILIVVLAVLLWRYKRKAAAAPHT